jgi:hypothetical protein
MLEILIVILVLIWIGGVSTAYTAGGLIHVLLIVAVIVFLMRLLQGRSV